MRADFFYSRRLLSLTFLLFFLGIYFCAPAIKACAPKVCKENKIKNTGREKAEIRQISLEAIVPALNHELRDIFVYSFISWPAISAEAPKPRIYFPFSVTRFFRNLFTCIISPNAP